MCNICNSEEKTKHLSLYVIGSEGINICHQCEMRLVEYIRQMRSLAGICKKRGFVQAKQLFQSKKENQNENIK